MRNNFLLVAAMLAACASASANQIVNGDFETGDFSGWTQSGGNVATGVGNLFHTGQYGYHAGTVQPGALTQTINTMIGEKYDFKFWVANGYGGTNSFSASWNGNTVLSLTNAQGFLYTFYTYQITADTVQTEIKFTYSHVPDFYGFDDVAVEHVPEPQMAGLVFVMLAAGVLLQFKSSPA